MHSKMADGAGVVDMDGVSDLSLVPPRYPCGKHGETCWVDSCVNQSASPKGRRLQGRCQCEEGF